MSPEVDPERVQLIEAVSGETVYLMYVEVWDGLYAPIGLRKPEGSGPFPVVLLAAGNGGGGMAWVRNAVRNRGYIMDRLVEAGMACAWLRYRTEVELGYNDGGRLVRDSRQGMEMFNRAPLEYEDEIAIADYFKTLPWVDGARMGLIGMSHGGEMALKIASEYHGFAAAVASEPAAHEFLALATDDSVFVNEQTNLRNIENMQMAEVAKVRGRVDEEIARARIDSIQTPFLIMGRDEDHLQGVFRTTFDLLAEASKDVEWVSYDHEFHGYVFPVRGGDGEYELNDVQVKAIDHVVGWLGKRLRAR
ncbi:MAG: prolyl oligopeptidase family serine peptidase [Albidovulum sp.]|nr:prolyl oligopeptidase family serine peptidase [Albidovulum sp.]MDE0532918.1 prolyl oligopeptidase family serine peptidase [Albidovulum sp.]